MDKLEKAFHSPLGQAMDIYTKAIAEAHDMIRKMKGPGIFTPSK